jgi:hypothetical protein
MIQIYTRPPLNYCQFTFYLLNYVTGQNSPLHDLLKPPSSKLLSPVGCIRLLPGYDLQELNPRRFGPPAHSGEAHRIT